MNNKEEKHFYRRKKAEKEYANNVTEYVIYNEPFMKKKPNQEHYSETFIAESGATSHMVNPEEKMMNLKDAKTRVTV